MSGLCISLYCLSYFYLGTSLINFWIIPITFSIAFLVFALLEQITVWVLKYFVVGVRVGFISLDIFIRSIVS